MTWFFFFWPRKSLCNVNTVPPCITSQQDSHESCIFQRRTWGTGCIWHQEKLLQAAPEAALGLCQQTDSLQSTNPVQKEAALHERECELIQRRCYFCWDEAMCTENHLLGRSNMPGLARMVPPVCHWSRLPAGLVSDNCLALAATPQHHKTPLFIAPLWIPCPMMLIHLFRWPNVHWSCCPPLSLSMATQSSTSWLRGQAQDQWCKETCDHSVTSTSLPLSS